MTQIGGAHSVVSMERRMCGKGPLVLCEKVTILHCIHKVGMILQQDKRSLLAIFCDSIQVRQKNDQQEQSKRITSVASSSSIKSSLIAHDAVICSQKEYGSEWAFIQLVLCFCSQVMAVTLCALFRQSLAAIIHMMLVLATNILHQISTCYAQTCE